MSEPQYSPKIIPLLSPSDEITRRKCPKCKDGFNMPMEFVGQTVICPLCGSHIETRSRFAPLGDAATIGGGCVSMIFGIALWLFMVGVIVIAAITFASWVLSKLGIIKVFQ